MGATAMSAAALIAGQTKEDAIGIMQVVIIVFGGLVVISVLWEEIWKRKGK